jgi:hypothetical protein
VPGFEDNGLGGRGETAAMNQSRLLVTSSNFRISFISWYTGVLTVSLLNGIQIFMDGERWHWTFASIALFASAICLLAIFFAAGMLLLEVGVTAIAMPKIGPGSKTTRFIASVILWTFLLMGGRALAAFTYAYLGHAH